MRLIVMLLTLPWWAYLPLAGGVAYLGHFLHSDMVARDATFEQALSAPPPAAMDLASFDADLDTGPGDEAVVTGWINTDYNYTLIERTNGVKTSERYLYMLFGAAEGPDATQVRAAILFDEAQTDQFIDQFDDHVIGETLAGDSIVELNGFARSYAAGSDQAFEAIADEGLTRADNFVFFTPFLDGREAAMAQTNQADTIRLNFWLVAVGMVIFAAFKKLSGGDQRRDPNYGDTFGDTLMPNRKPMAMSAGADKAMLGSDVMVANKKRDVAAASGIDPNSPLGRLAAGKGTGAAYASDAQANLGGYGAAVMALSDEKQARKVAVRKTAKASKGALVLNVLVILATAAAFQFDRDFFKLMIIPVAAFFVLQTALGRFRRMNEEYFEVIPRVDDYEALEMGDMAFAAPTPDGVEVSPSAHAAPAIEASPVAETKAPAAPAPVTSEIYRVRTYVEDEDDQLSEDIAEAEVDTMTLTDGQRRQPSLSVSDLKAQLQAIEATNAPAEVPTELPAKVPAKVPAAKASRKPKRRGPTLIKANPRERLKADPFAKLAQEARGV